MNINSSRPLVAAIAPLLMFLCRPAGIAANSINEPICDTTADHFLVTENYAEAIRLHQEILRKQPQNALAHYHLGFAEGMAGDKAHELSEYRRAAALGLSALGPVSEHGIGLAREWKSRGGDGRIAACRSAQSEPNRTSIWASSTSATIC